MSECGTGDASDESFDGQERPHRKTTLEAFAEMRAEGCQCTPAGHTVRCPIHKSPTVKSLFSDEPIYAHTNSADTGMPTNLLTDHIDQLERERDALKRRLVSTIEEKNTLRDELQIANELPFRKR